MMFDFIYFKHSIAASLTVLSSSIFSFCNYSYKSWW